MEAAVVISVISSMIALIGVIYTARMTLRGGLPEGAKSLAEGFKMLNDERQEQIKERDAEITLLRSELNNLRDDLKEMASIRSGERAQMRQQIEDQDDKIAQMENYINALVGGIRILIDQLEGAGITPKWKPPPWQTPKPKSRPEE